MHIANEPGQSESHKHRIPPMAREVDQGKSFETVISNRSSDVHLMYSRPKGVKAGLGEGEKGQVQRVCTGKGQRPPNKS